MISWIQRTFQHHFRLIFAVLLVGMIIPFIATIGSTPGVGRAEQKTAMRDFFGHNMMSPREVQALMEDTRLSAQLQYGMTNVSQDDLQTFLYQRTAAKHLADQVDLPPATTAEITEYIKHLRIFAGADGQFDVSRYDAFRNSLKVGSSVTEADIARVVSDDTRMYKIGRLLAGPGYAMPSDVKEILSKGDTLWTISTATVNYASFAPDLTLTDADITKFFSDNVFRYTIAPRVAVDYVQFPAAAFLGEVSPTDAEVREFYDSDPSRFPAPDAAKGAPVVKADPASTYASVQNTVRQALVAEMAKQKAVKAASDLAYGLYEGKVTRASLDAFLANRKLTPASLAPFSAESGPSELGGSKEIANAAFELNADRFYSEGLPSPTGALVLFWKASLPARDPALSEIRAKVVADATDNQKRIRFAEFGRSLRAGIERRIKSGEAFDKAANEAAGSVKIEVKSYPPFSLRQQSRDVDPVVYQMLDSLDKGTVSDLQVTADKGLVVYAADKKAPAVDESNPRYAQIKLQLASTFAQTDETMIIREVVDQELKRTAPDAK
jgi:peptidyl-prolyl cis-trans isomerase D